MKELKRALSVLLALLVAFSVMSTGFVGASAATPPIVPRNKYDNPVPTINAPSTITVQGGNQYVSGTSVQGGKSVSFSLPGATNVRVERNSSGLSLGLGGDPSVSGNVYTWSINSSSTATPNTYIFITFGYIYQGVTYYTTVYIWADPAHVGASVTNNTSRKPSAWLYTSYTNHTLSVYPAYGSAVSVANDNYASGYFNYGSSSFVGSSSTVTGMQWTNNSSSDGTRTIDASYIPTATYYVNSASGISDMSESDLTIAERIHGGEIGTTGGIESIRMLDDLYVSGNTSYGTTFDGKDVKFSADSMGSDLLYKLTGPVPSSGKSVSFELYDNFLGRLQTAGGGITTSYNAVVGMKVKLIGYDKTQLNGLINNEKNKNRQASQLGSNWSTYEAAFSNAYAINVKPNATQSEINSAYQTLYTIVYNTLGETLANYNAVDALLSLLGKRAIYYPDRMAYYTQASGNALLDAVADIYYDYHALLSSQQTVVNQMATNLRNAMEGLKFASYYVTYSAETSFIAPILYEVNSTVTHPGIPIRDGWEFDGWYYDAAHENPVQWPITMPAKDFTLYAKWNRITSFIYFDSRGGTEVPDYEGGIYDPYTGPTVVPTMTGYTFSRWYYDSALTAPVNWSTFTMPAVSRTLYAGYDIDQHTVSFETFVSTEVEPITQNYWTSVEEPEAPLFESKKFDSWYYDEALTDKVVWPFPMPGEDITLYAKWIEDQYTITFISPEDTVGNPQTIWANYGQSIFTPTAPTRAGYNFGGWYYDSGFQTPVAWSNFTMPNRNLVIYAKWDPKQTTIVFNSDGGSSVKAVRSPVGAIIEEPERPTKANMMFVAWAKADGTHVVWPLSMPSATTTILKAIWRDMPDMYSYRLEARTDSGSYVLRQGDNVDFDVYLKTNYNIGSFSAVIYYDSRYFEPSIGGTAYTDRFFTSINDDNGFFKRGYNFAPDEPGYNAWQVGAVKGSVNNSDRVVAYYPASWRSGTNLSSQYINYRYIWFNVVCSSSTSQTGGVCMTIEPEQKVFSFQLRVRDTAPATAEGTYTPVMMPEAAAYSPTNTSGQIYVVKKDGNQATDPNIQTGIEHDLSKATKSFQISERERYVIFFDTNGSSQTIEPITLSEGYSIDLPELENGPRKSSIFAGWSLGGVLVNDPYIMPAGNVTLKAQWEAEYITSYYQMDTSGNYGSEPEYTVYNTAVVGSTVTANLIEFEGFAYNSALSALTNSGMVIDSDEEIPGTNPVEYKKLQLKVYYDRKLVTITYNANGGTLQGNSSTTAYYDSAVAPPPDPIKPGFTFVAWTYNGNVFRVSRMPANNMELIALWDTRKYLVKFYVGDAGSPHYTFEGYFGDTIQMPDMNLEGQRFSGWFADWAYYTPFTLTTVPDKDISVYGYYLPSGYTVTFFLNGNKTGDTFKAEPGTPIEFPDYNRVGYEFSGWYKDSAYTIPYTGTVVPSEDINIYAKNTIMKFTITYFLNGEQYLQPYTRNYGAPIVTANVIAPSGYEFGGWYTDPEYTERFDLSKMPAYDFPLYGQLVVKKYTLTFFVDGVPDDTLTLTDFYNSEITLPTPTTEVVYDFDGWYYDAEYTLKAELLTMPGEDMDLFGKLIPATLTITYYMDGVYYAEKGIVYNTAITHITSPSKQYATFDGWYSDPECTQRFTLTVMPAEEFIIYGRFIPDPATITFDLNTGLGTTPAPIPTGVGLVITLPVPIDNSFYKSNYVFAGWGETAGTTSSYAINGDYTVPPGGKTLYAVWKAVTIEILPVQGSTTVIDESRSYIYGLREGLSQAEFVASFISVQGNGKIVVGNPSGSFGTGSVVTLYNKATNAIIKTYTVIIFGDINGDANVDSLDISMVSRAASKLDTLLGYKFFAANINKDGSLDSLDLSVISRDAAKLALINQVDPTRA